MDVGGLKTNSRDDDVFVLFQDDHPLTLNDTITFIQLSKVFCDK